MKRARNREPWCVICREARTQQAHHIIFRSHGGDDTRGNLCGTCFPCHDLIHVEDVGARVALGLHVQTYRQDTIEYLYEKLTERGALDFLSRRLLVQ